MSLASSVDLQEHADPAGVVRVCAALREDPLDARDLEHLADAVGQIVELRAEGGARLGGGGLVQQRIGRVGAGSEGQLLREIVGELTELVVIGHRRALALQLDDRGDALLPVAEHGDPAGGGLAVAARESEFLSLFAERLDGLLRIAAGGGQRLLALHHGQSGAVAQRFDGGRRNLSRHRTSSWRWDSSNAQLLQRPRWVSGNGEGFQQ
jgi:hypothetical protein